MVFLHFLQTVSLERAIGHERRKNIRRCMFLLSQVVLFCFFFFQAEDGIRDRNVTGVQTCALPISMTLTATVASGFDAGGARRSSCGKSGPFFGSSVSIAATTPSTVATTSTALMRKRSEERRVGKECRSRWAAEH